MRSTAIAIALGLAAAPLPARADPVATQAAMETYFDGEVRGGYVLVGVGIAGLTGGGYLYTRDDDRARGASYPLLGIGALHVAAGVFVAIASNRRLDTFTTQIADDEAGFLREEQSRMAGVSRTFVALKIVEVVLIAGGLGVAGYAYKTDRPLWQGIGAAIAVEAAATLAFDVFAARRADRYRGALGAQVTPRVGAERDAGLMLSYRGAF